MNNIILIGRLTKDVDLRYVPNTGTPVANFTIAVDRNYKNKEGKVDTDFIPVQLMGKIAESTAKYVQKGSMVAVQGSIRIDKYDKDGETRSYTKVAARNIQFLDTKKDKSKDNEFIPSFDPNGFQAVDDDEIPF